VGAWAIAGRIARVRGRMSPVTEDDVVRLRQATVFSALGEDQVQRFAAAATTTEHPAGESLTEQGTLGHRFYLMLDGAAEVERDGHRLATIGPGDFVGELGLLGGGPSTATVRCTEPTRCLTLRREAFWEVLEEEPAIALRILEVLSRRLVRELRTGATANIGDE
jgi:CRP/FNR family cyclic AMP-dependent transcriptional regulator